MRLEVLISKKGTKVVKASNLYDVLRLPKSRYSQNLSKWLKDYYEFKDGIRQPAKFKDYAKRVVPNEPGDDYYFSIELAKHITLNSNSKFKSKYANNLLSLEDKVDNAELISKNQIISILELSKAMGLVSCQVKSEREHMKRYQDQNGSPANWWKYREQVLGYSPSSYKALMKKKGKQISGKSQRQLLLEFDRYEAIRAGVIDLCVAMGKSITYAINMGDIAKILAKELQIEIQDDVNPTSKTVSNAGNIQLVNEINTMQKEEILNRL